MWTEWMSAEEAADILGIGPAGVRYRVKVGDPEVRVRSHPNRRNWQQYSLYLGGADENPGADARSEDPPTYRGDGGGDLRRPAPSHPGAVPPVAPARPSPVQGLAPSPALAELDGVKRLMVISDPHLGGGEDVFAWNCAVKAIGVVRPDILVLLGDVVDLESMSSHAAHGNRPSLQAELDDANAKLDRVDELRKAAGCDRVVMLEGNHEDRYLRTLSQRLPAVIGAVKTISEHLRVRERGWEWVPFRQTWFPFRGSPIGYTHGAWANKHCAAAGLERYKHAHAIRFGHVHRSQKFVIGQDCGTRFVVGMASPTLRTILWSDVKYTQGPPDWSHGIGVDEISPCGAYSMANYEMTDRRLVFDRQVIDGREP